MQDFMVITLEPAINLLLKPEKLAFHNTNNTISDYFHLKTDFLIKNRKKW